MKQAYLPETNWRRIWARRWPQRCGDVFVGAIKGNEYQIRHTTLSNGDRVSRREKRAGFEDRLVLYVIGFVFGLLIVALY
jgi:hypothetical protein